MKKLGRAGSTFGTVVAAAVVIAVASNGGAVAGGLITSKQIKNNTIKSIDVRDGNLTGTAVADGSISGPDVADGSISSADIADGSVTGGDVADSSLTGNDVQDFSLSNQDVGVLWAQINSNGTVANSSGGVTASHLLTGDYEVDWGRNVQSCAFVATQGEDGIGGAVGAIMGVTDRLGNANGTFVTVRDNTNTLVDRAFQVMAVC